MKISFNYILLVALCFAGCNNNDINGGLLTFDAASAIDNSRPFDLAEISTDIEFIPLDDNSTESLIGSIGTMDESESRFYISDNVRKPIKIFDKAGKFLTEFGVIGRGPNEIPYIGSFSIDHRRNNVYICEGGSRIVAYDADGNHFARKDSIMRVLKIICHNDKLIVSHYPEGTKQGDEMTLLTIFSSELKQEAEINVISKGPTNYTTTDSDGYIWVNYLPEGVMSGNENFITVKETLNDTVFHYGKDKVLEPAYRLDLGNRTIPSNAVGSNAAEPWNERFSSFYNIWEGDKYIVARASSMGTVAHLVFDKRDPSNGFSATDSGGKPGFFIDDITFTPKYIRDNRLVGYMQAFDIVNNADAITNPDLKALAATLKEDSNPVIVVAKLKK